MDSDNKLTASYYGVLCEQLSLQHVKLCPVFCTAQPLATSDGIHHNIIIPGISLLFYAFSVLSTLGAVDAVSSMNFTTGYYQSLLCCITNFCYLKWSANSIAVCKQPIVVFLLQNWQMQNPLVEVIDSAKAFKHEHVHVKIWVLGNAPVKPCKPHAVHTSSAQCKLHHLHLVNVSTYGASLQSTFSTYLSAISSKANRSRQSDSAFAEENLCCLTCIEKNLCHCTSLEKVFKADALFSFRRKASTRYGRLIALTIHVGIA